MQAFYLKTPKNGGKTAKFTHAKRTYTTRKNHLHTLNFYKSSAVTCLCAFSLVVDVAVKILLYSENATENGIFDIFATRCRLFT